MGNVHLKWAFSEAAVLFLRNNPEGQKLVARLERKHGKAKALSSLAHKFRTGKLNAEESFMTLHRCHNL